MADAAVRRALFLVLALLIVALVYDKRVAKPAFDKALEKMNDELLAEKEEHVNESGFITEQKVHEVLRREPSTVVHNGGWRIETYNWRRGLPFLSYSIIAVYGKRDGEWELSTAYYNQDPPATYMAAAPAIVPAPDLPALPLNSGPP